MPENFGRRYPEPNLPRHMPENFGRKVTFILLEVPAASSRTPSSDLASR